MNDNDHGTEVLLGGLIVLVIITTIALKALDKVFTQLHVTFDSFALVAHSAGAMVFSWSKIAILIAVAVGIVACAIYFSYRYILMVKEGTELLDDYNLASNQLRCDFDTFAESLREEISGEKHFIYKKVQRLEERLEIALKPPEVAPIANEVSESGNQTTVEPPIAEASIPENKEAQIDQATSSEANLSSSLNPY